MTAQALLSLTCLKKLKVLQHHLQQRVNVAIDLGAAYLRSMVITERANAWIGNEYSTPTAVLAIMEWNEWNEDRWRCRYVCAKSTTRPRRPCLKTNLCEKSYFFTCLIYSTNVFSFKQRKGGK